MNTTGKILGIVFNMGAYRIHGSWHSRIFTKNLADVKCSSCNKELKVTVESIYKQHLRGREKYICKPCASKQSWTKRKRKIAAARSKIKWQDPEYAGKITGKAMARGIINAMDKNTI